MRSICPAAKLIEWREDDRAATMCVARPLNALVAWTNDRPLSRGVTRSWSLASYRQDPGSEVAQIIAHLEREGPCRLVGCMLGRDGRIISGLLWRGATQPPAVVPCACHDTLPACPAADPIWGIWGNLGELENHRRHAAPLWGRLLGPRS